MAKTELTNRWREWINTGWPYAVGVAVLLVLSAIEISQKDIEKNLKVSGISFNSALSSDAAPKTIGALKDVLSAKSLRIEFNFKALDDHYDNLFQTGDSATAIRMELNSPNKLNLILGDDEIIPVLDNLSLGQNYHVLLRIQFGQDAAVVMDGIERAHVNLQNRGSSDVIQRYDFSKIVVGTGFSRQRGFQGQINNFGLTLQFEEEGLIKKIVYATSAVLCTALSLLLVARIRRTYIRPTGNIRTWALASALAIASFAPLMAIVGVLFVQELNASKWLPHILFLFGLLPFLVGLRIAFLPDGIAKKYRYLLGAIVIASSAIIVATSVSPFFKGYSIRALLVLSLGLGATIYLLTLQLTNELASLHKKMALVAVLAIFSLLAWTAIVDLPNWSDFADPFKPSKALNLVAALVGLMIAVSFVLDGGYRTIPRNNKKKQSGWLLFWVKALPPIGIFLWLSFRTDSLFLGSSALHWEYYVGPIRTLQSGGWLLWDTASQYGFLSIWMPALLPLSAWQSLYVFQALLLFIVSCGVYFTALRYAQTVVDRVVAFVITLVGIFFAHPDLIGPSLYPSSSVMRFVWCYALLLFLLVYPNFSYKQFLIACLLWVASVLWSAESGVYGSMTFFLAVLVRILACKPSDSYHARTKKFLIYMLSAMLALIGVFVGMVLFYKLELGVYPDFFAYAEHALSYAAGFGSAKLKWNGPILLLGMLGVGLVLCMVGARGKKDLLADKAEILVPLAGMTGCLWAISTYYIGRPFATNVTAILPILGIITFFATIFARSSINVGYAVIFKTVAVPLIFLLLFPVFTPRFLTTFFATTSFSGDITNHLPKDNADLKTLLTAAGVSDRSPLAYYGDSAAMPLVVINGREFVPSVTWLPAPLQLLEEPISPERRLIYIDRFVHAHYRDGFLIQKNGESLSRFKQWLEIIDRFYQIKHVYPGKVYTVWQFKSR